MNRLSKRWAIGAVILAVAFGGWKLVQSRRAETAAAATATAAAASAAPAAQRNAVELAPTDILTAATVEMGRTIPVSGGLKAVSTAWVKAKVAGELVQLLPREGDNVAAGQVIGRIETREYDLRVEQAERSAQAAKAQVDITKRQLDNNKALVEQGFVSPTALDTAVGNDNAARANLAAAQSAIDLARKSRGDANLRAPISGTVSQRAAQAGERVAIDARVLEIVDLSKLELEAAIAPEDAVALRTGMPALLRIEGVETPLKATVARISPSTQAGSRAVLAYLSVPSLPGLRTGLFARGTVQVELKQALAVPVTAVRLDDTSPQLLVLAPGADGTERIARTPVTLGRRGLSGEDEVVEVLSGLPLGARYLRASVGSLADKTPVRRSAAAERPAAAASATGPSSAASQP